mmetsp:Transcript_20954/g.30695  ORF Transcript_20954/g.30695 Transcript_20954/m.30695 type:complete len:332 (-) Transcript_20954:1131-2126(-)|eukprot:CAMPEP_0197237226 /NCGR_PEP_ID=MMETSP1429-20130617/4115_1 /TAXON_ID=49237 /ORGANISM="Chaetoceros  sp., Strain UNC1202" /LENGTH=331 /DNA_ID=CAMNT_0042696191 /DNA_START=91 /DNA_END=1086 /DNA_ORIENTATION=-
MSSVIHIILSTSPFFFLFLYFIYSADHRPFVLYERYEQRQAGNQVDEDITLFPLMDYLRAVMGTIVFWSFLTIYLAVFVRKRRQLMKRYLAEGGSTGSTSIAAEGLDNGGGGRTQKVHSVIGNVCYDRPRSFLSKCTDKFSYTDLAYVTYKHPEGEQGDEAIFVEKKIRTYHPYHRENVAILVLDGHALSGQPKADVERDVASFQDQAAIHNRAPNQVIAICLFWTFFSLVTAIYILLQMGKIDEMNLDEFGEENTEDVEYARKFFWIFLCGVTPALAIGGNAFQWMMHYHWVTRAGKIVLRESALTMVVPKVLGADEFEEEEGSKYIQLT